MRPHGQSGFVLIIVLGVIMALCAILFSFTEKARTQLAQAEGFYRAQEAWTGAWAGLQIALSLVHDANEAGLDPRWGQPTGFDIADVNGTFTLTAENGLLNVNRLVTTDGRPDREHIQQLLRLIDALNRDRKDAPLIGYGLAAALVDWIDPDDQVASLSFVPHDGLGAENDYYQTQQPPRSCRNSPIQALEELLPVRGMTPELLQRLRPLVTCVGDGKIDLNAAPALVLQALSEQMDGPLAEMIIRQRQYQPFRDLAELKSIPAMTDNVYRDLQAAGTLQPQERFYRLRAHTQRVGHSCTIEALLRKNLQSQTVDILQYREL